MWPASETGLVGAGRIGQLRLEVVRTFKFQQTCAIMLIIVVVVVTLVGGASQALRPAFI